MYWFRPYIWNTDVESYIKSLYELRASPIRSENHPYWHKADFFKRGKWYDFYHILSYRVDFHGNEHPCDTHMRADTMREVREMKAEGFRYFTINPSIQENTPYRFPAHLPLVFEVEDASNTMPLPLRQEFAAMYARLRHYSVYYFDPQIYDDLLLQCLYDPPHESKSELFLRPWKGPYFRSDADWLYILQWIANKYLDIYNQQNTLQRLKERQAELVRTCLIKETRFAWLGWYEPVPVREWEELAKIKAFARDSNQEFLVGDNVKYMMRPGPPLYGTDEAERRIANQIKLLPKFNARVRIASGEYTITTEKPSGYSNEQELHRRIQAIQEQNTKDGYIHLRADVEAELMQRRQSLLSSSSSVQKPQQQSSHRVARQVPVKGKCQNCGASNLPGAKFCNQCGEQL
jgi:hypothetical protein